MTNEQEEYANIDCNTTSKQRQRRAASNLEQKTIPHPKAGSLPATSDLETRTVSITSPTMLTPRHLFLASIGNPAPYLTTLHSAGHILLHSLATHLNLPTLRPGGSTSTPDSSITLFHSPAMMNISGQPISKAWKSYLARLPAEARPHAKLYILHDELESPLGKVKLKHTGSPKGHNGLKSLIAAFGGKQDAFSRVGVGIGRPESRERGDVLKYVLRNCSPREMSAIRDAVDEVVRVLEIG